MASKRQVYVRKDSNPSDWARRRFLEVMTEDMELREVFVVPLWEKVRPVFLDWTSLLSRAKAGEPIQQRYLPTSDGSPLLLAAWESFRSHSDLWGSVRLANDDGSWPDLIPLRQALEQWALSIHLQGQEWVMLAAMNLIWDWWKSDSVEPECDDEVYFGHSDEADFPPDVGMFEFSSHWPPSLFSADDYRKEVERAFHEQLDTYLTKADLTMREAGYIPVPTKWHPEAMVWFGLHHCGSRTYSQIIALCKPNCGEPAIAKGVQQIRGALGVPPRPTVRGHDRRTRRPKAK